MADLTRFGRLGECSVDRTRISRREVESADQAIIYGVNGELQSHPAFPKVIGRLEIFNEVISSLEATQLVQGSTGGMDHWPGLTPPGRDAPQRLALLAPIFVLCGVLILSGTASSVPSGTRAGPYSAAVRPSSARNTWSAPTRDYTASNSTTFPGCTTGSGCLSAPANASFPYPMDDCYTRGTNLSPLEPRFVDVSGPHPDSYGIGYPGHYYTGVAYYSSSPAVFQASTIYATIGTPSSGPRYNDLYYELLSAFDVSGSYDQIGLSSDYCSTSTYSGSQCQSGNDAWGVLVTAL
jgi:hypothetical protein